MTQAIVPTSSERPFPAGSTLVSKTDLDGNITYMSEQLLEVTGYAEEEIIGQPHSIMRHPDVPEPVFDHLWKTLRNGRPWRGVLKSICKNGDSFWSDAYMVPLKQRGTLVGYMSARSEPSKEQIREAEADYAYAARHGRVRAESGVRPMRYFTIKRSVLTGILFVLAATFVSALVGMKALNKTSFLVYELQRNNDVSALVTKANQQIAVAVSNILLVLQHAPGKSRDPLHDQMELNEHLALIKSGTQELSKILGTLSNNRSLDAPEQLDQIVAGFASRRTNNTAAIKGYIEASQRLMDNGLTPVVNFIEQGRLLQAKDLIIDDVGPLAIAANKKSDVVSDALFSSSLDIRRTVDDLYDATLDYLIYWSLLIALVVGISGIIFFRETMRPLKSAMDQMDLIAEGNLSQKSDVYGFGEPGRVASAVATMQIQLMVMLDEIQQASSAVRGQVKKLNQAVLSILNSTEDQFDQALQINEALQLSEDGTGHLNECCAKAAALAQYLAESKDGMTADEIAELAHVTQEAASLANLNALAAGEIQRLSNKIMEQTAINREGSNDAWGTGLNLDDTSKKLDTMLDKFK